MRNRFRLRRSVNWLLVLTFVSWPASPEPSVNTDCQTDGRNWDTLVADFTANWHGPHDFCETKRALTLNRLLLDDMTAQDSKSYYAHVEPLQAFNNQSEAANALLMGFQETWFTLHLNDLLDQDFSSSNKMTKGITYGISALAMVLLASQHFKQYSGKTIRFLQMGWRSFFAKRPALFRNSNLKLALLRPPILIEADRQAMDPRTAAVFQTQTVQDFSNLAAEGGVAWISGHLVQTRIEKIWPRWRFLEKTVFDKWRFAYLTRPPSLAATVVSIAASWLLQAELEKLERNRQIARYQNEIKNITELFSKLLDEGKDYEAWFVGERLKNQLILDHYMLTEDLGQALMEIESDEVGRILNWVDPCSKTPLQITESDRQAYVDAVQKAINAHSPSVMAALALSKQVQDKLGGKPFLLSNDINSANTLLLSDSLMSQNAAEVAASEWPDIEDQVRQASAGAICNPIQTDFLGP